MLPEFISEVRYRLRALFHRSAMERELDDELQSHLQHEAEKRMRAGMSPAEAIRQAHIALGGVEVTKEATRESRGIGWLEHMRQDLRYAIRSLRRNPGFTVAVILTLGLGIGVNAAMFGIVDRLLFRTPPFLRDPEQVHRVYLQSTDRGERSTDAIFQYTRYLDLQRFTTMFSAMAGFSTRTLPVGSGVESREMQVGTISANLFDFFEARPVLGRFFTHSEDTVPVGALVAVLGYDYWQTNYGGRSDALGQQLAVGTVKYTIIGVAPRHFIGLSDAGPPAVFVPITAYAGTFRAGTKFATSYYTRYNWGWMEVLARRKPGVSIDEASADLSHAFVQSWNAEAALNPSVPPVEVAHPTALAGPVQTERGPKQNAVTRVAAWVSGVALIVLIIACANVANLLLARAIRRRREIALRLALGVSRARLVAQLLTENLLLAGCGGFMGLLLAHWGGAVLRTLFLPAGAPGGALADGRTVGFAVVVTLIAGMLTGLTPILQARRTDLVESLKSGARDGTARRSRTRTALLLLQAALSVVLLVGAGLFVRSLLKLQSTRLGYDVDQILYMQPNERGAGLSAPEKIALRQRLLEQARVLPGVEQAALGLTVPFWDTWSEDLFISGIDSVNKLGDFTLQGGSPEFFGTLGTRILRGRGIEAGDREGAPKVVIVSEAMAQKLWPGQEALGRCMRIGADTVPCATVVGIAENIRQRHIIDDPGLHYYLPIAQYNPEAAVLFVRARGDPERVAGELARQLQPSMPGDGYLTVTSLHDIIGLQTQSWRLGAAMFLAFGGLALVLAAIGLYSVIAYDVAQRTHELGIRIALGARVTDVIRLVVGTGLRVTLVGIATGGTVALWAGRWLAPLLFAQSPSDPLVFGLVTCVLLVTALLASAIPAFKASQVDPNEALRAE
ncbi:MAG: ABC transporter permease [Gemmatimonadota bacterium]